MKINKIALVAALASTMATSIAQAQVKITGYLESSYMAGSGRNVSGSLFTPNGGTGSATTAILDPQKGIGNESQLRFTTTHSVMGMNAEAMLELRRQGGATPSVYEERELRLSTADGSIIAFVGTDFQRGIETVRNVYPSVNNRAGDIIGGGTGIIDPLDSTSGESYIGIELPKLAGSTRVSFAYAPQLSTSGNMTSYNSDVLLDRSTANQNRYSIGITQPIGPVTLGVGYMGGENKIAASGSSDQDPESKSIGLRYVAGPVGLGAQYFINNNPTATATKNEDKQRTVSGTYALTKELSIGLIYTVQENTALGVTDPDKIKQHVVQAGYNLGPVVFQGDYVRVRDAQYINNQEVDAVKLKAKVNF